jgi:predicted O-methyltransferase YrrM
METIKQKLQRAWGQRQSKGTVLWPKVKKKPRVLYETDASFHAVYDHALAMTQMRDIALRRQRYYTFPALLRGVAEVPGDVCEVGCYRGLSAYLIASILRDLKKPARFHLCDSFAGLSEFATVDKSRYHNMDRPKKRRKYVCSLEVVQCNLREFDFIEYHQGWIPAPFQALTDSRFCFVHVDVDLYQPTRDSFEFFYPRLSPYGVMVFDDYGTEKFPGARQAIDECLTRVRDAFFVTLPSGQAFLLKKAASKEVL